MLNKKDNLIIFVLALLVISLAVFVMTKDIDLNKNKNQNNNKNIYVNQEQKDNRYNPINKNRNVNKPPSIDYSGELTKEANGWKKYRNEYWGVEFRFRDKKDEMKVAEWSVGVIVADSKSENPYIYIDFYNYSGKEYGSLKEYLEAGRWNSYQEEAKLISLKEIVNNNGLTFIEVIANVSGGRQAKGYYNSQTGYIEYNKKNIREDKKSYRQLINAQDYISIFGMSNYGNLRRQILDNFNFID